MSKQLTAQAPVDPIVLGKMGSSYGIRGRQGATISDRVAALIKEVNKAA